MRRGMVGVSGRHARAMSRQRALPHASRVEPPPGVVLILNTTLKFESAAAHSCDGDAKRDRGTLGVGINNHVVHERPTVRSPDAARVVWSEARMNGAA